MFGVLLKKQWTAQLLLIVFFCTVYFISSQQYIKSEEYYLDEQTEYLQMSDLTDSKLFFEELEKDKKTAEHIVSSIENFDGYSGDYKELQEEFIEEMTDPELFLAGVVSYATYDMVVWKENMLMMPGEYTDNLLQDQYMLSTLERRFFNQKYLSDNIENLKEIARRGLRRNISKTPMYEKGLEHLEKVETLLPVTESINADMFLTHVETTGYVYLIIILCVFSTFSNLKQNKISDVILISQKGVRRYTFLQLRITVITTIGSFVVYYGIVSILLGAYRFKTIWKYPIQTLAGYQNVTLSISVLEYLILLLFIKLLFGIVVAVFSSLISLVSGNNYISAVLHSICIGVWYVVSSGELTGSMWKTLLSGGGKELVSYFPYFCIGNIAVWYGFIYGIVLVLISITLFGGTILCSKTLIKGR